MGRERVYRKFCEIVMHSTAQRMWHVVSGRNRKISKIGIIKVTSNSCCLARKYLQATIMEKSSKHFLGAQHVGVLLSSTCQVMHAMREKRRWGWDVHMFSGLWFYWDHRDVVGWLQWLQCCNGRISLFKKDKQGRWGGVLPSVLMTNWSAWSSA